MEFYVQFATDFFNRDHFIMNSNTLRSSIQVRFPYLLVTAVQPQSATEQLNFGAVPQ